MTCMVCDVEDNTFASLCQTFFFCLFVFFFPHLHLSLSGKAGLHCWRKAVFSYGYLQDFVMIMRHCTSENPGMNTQIEGHIERKNITVKQGWEGVGSREILDLMLLWDCRTSQRRRDNRSPIWYLIGIDPVARLKILTVGKSIHFRHGAMPYFVSVCFCVDIQSLGTQQQKKGCWWWGWEQRPHESRIRQSWVRVGQENEAKKQETKKRINEREKEGGNAGNTETESRRWEKQQTSFNISSEMIYLSTLWQHHPPGLTKPTRSSIMEACGEGECGQRRC